MQNIITPGMLSETSIFSPEKFIEWRRKKGAFNFDKLPKKVILGLDKNIFSRQFSFFPKKVRGLSGYNYVHSEFVFCSMFMTGAPAVIELLEQLHALGVEEFIFIGLAGILSDDIKTGDVFFIDKTLSGVGVTRYYSPDSMIVPYDINYCNDWGAKLNLRRMTCFSTDAPFRETPSLIAAAKENGCSLIEMECAAIYAFAQYYKLKAICLLVAADKAFEEWTPPSSKINLTLIQKELVNCIVKSSK
jgi:purine-nucleoside phosphorylase